MYRLSQLSQKSRGAIGWSAMGMGLVVLVLGVWWLHFSSFPVTQIVDGEEVPVVLDYFDWVPRGALWKGLGYLTIFGAVQLLLIGAAFAFIVGRPMTWPRALFSAFISWVQLVFIFGMVPSEWLTYAATDLEWTNQRIALAIPPFLVLGNDVQISYGVLKDSISMGYHVVMLALAGLFAYKIQDLRGEGPAPAERPQRTSPYGRPLVKGSR